MSLMELERVTYAYPKAVEGTALRGVSVRVERGERISLRGSSGSGKSTLLAVMGLLMPPAEGALRFLDEDMGTAAPERRDRLRNEELGFVFQHHFLMPELTALENVALPAHVHAGRPRPEAIARARELLGRLGLAGKTDRLPRQVSGGEQQRIAIARALVNRPSLLLADEPTGNLDSANGRTVLRLFSEVVEEFGCGLVLATHDDEVAAACDRHLHIVDGRIVG